MTALINLFELDVSRMNHIPVKSVDELRQMVAIKLKELDKLQKRIKLDEESMSVNLASESIIRPDLFPEAQFDDHLGSGKMTINEIMKQRSLNEASSEKKPLVPPTKEKFVMNPILMEMGSKDLSQEKKPEPKNNSLKKPIRIYQNEENNYDVVMNQGAVSYVSKKKVVDNFDDIVEPSLNNKKRERVEIDLDFDESEAQLQDFLDSPEKKKNVSTKKNNKKVC